MINRLILTLLSLLAATLAGCATPDQSFHTLPALASRHHVCGVTIAIVKARKLDSFESATGCRPESSVNQDSVFQAASLSKPVFAYAVLRLVARGAMELDAPIVKYLPRGYRHQSGMVTDPRLAAVTVRMALNHTSGLPNWAPGALKFDADPGTRWEYSGEGYVLLQRAVESVSGQPLDRFMASQVFVPLGMTRSAYVWNEHIAPFLLAGTKANGTLRKTALQNDPNAAFSLYTSASDYAKFMAALLDDKDLIAQATKAPVAVDAALGLSWGLGWGMEQTADASYIWQWGNNRGYRAFAMASMRTGDGFVMLTNSENGLELAAPMAQRILPGEHRLFRSPILGYDIINKVCTTLRVCL